MNRTIEEIIDLAIQALRASGGAEREFRSLLKASLNKPKELMSQEMADGYP
jgi:hypothetical protein